MARFKKMDEQDFGEYFLVGTLASVVVAGAIAFLIQQDRCYSAPAGARERGRGCFHYARLPDSGFTYGQMFASRRTPTFFVRPQTKP